MSDLIERPCTCHPDDNPPRPCPGKFALHDCLQAALREKDAEIARLVDKCNSYVIHNARLNERAEVAEARVRELEAYIASMTMQGS